MAPQNSQTPSTPSSSATTSFFTPQKLLLLILLSAFSGYLILSFLYAPHYDNPTNNTSTMSKVSASTFLQAFSHRRSVYTLNNTSPISDSRIEEIVAQVVAQTPTPYNTQTTRYVVLLGEKSKEFWTKVAEITKKFIVGIKGEESWKHLEPRFGIFIGAYGSILFFEDGAAIKSAQETHADAAHMFPQWSEHASAMAQVILWTSLELEGFGANLQHLNAIPGVTDEARKWYGLPDGWDLKAQLVFGQETGEHPAPKPKKPLSEVVTVLK